MPKILFEKVRKLDLPDDKYAIFGSGPLGIKNIRECKDIDLVVTDELFNELKNSSEWKYGEFERDNTVIPRLEKDEIEVCKTWWPGEWDVNKLIEEAEIIDNLPFVQIKEVLRWKELSGREKDKKDIELIKNYLNKQE